MTAQVAVLNLSGVAVASDTYVTTGVGDQLKSMGNTHKIYELGSQHRVLLLHSGSANINSIPLQLHVAEWAKTLSLPLPTMQAYTDSYRTWAASEKRMSRPEAEFKVMNSTLNEHYHDLARELDAAIEGIHFAEEPTDRKRKAAVRRQIQETIDGNEGYLQGLESYHGVTERSTAKALSEHGFDLADKVHYIFDRFEIDEKQVEQLVSLATLILTRIQPMDSDSEIGFVGYGDEDPFPTVVRVKVRGIYAGVLVAANVESPKVAPIENGSSIVYFAQRDAMWGFVNGSTYETMEEIKRQIADAIEDKWGHTTPEPIGYQIAEEISAKMDAYSHERYVRPMLKTIEAMGMNSLASLADSLVGLQATATYSQAGAATVGGLIEVATIDRIDGVQWKRSLPRNHDDKGD